MQTTQMCCKFFAIIDVEVIHYARKDIRVMESTFSSIIRHYEWAGLARS